AGWGGGGGAGDAGGVVLRAEPDSDVDGFAVDPGGGREADALAAGEDGGVGGAGRAAAGAEGWVVHSAERADGVQAPVPLREGWEADQAADGRGVGGALAGPRRREERPGVGLLQRHGGQPDRVEPVPREAGRDGDGAPDQR